MVNSTTSVEKKKKTDMIEHGLENGFKLHLHGVLDSSNRRFSRIGG